jgi:hypothetical protein
MADTRWLGRAGEVAEVDTITMSGSWSAAETVTVSINGKDLVCVIGTSVANADVATLVKEAWEGDTTLTDTTASYTPAGGGPAFTEFSQLTATVSGAAVTLTADTAGVPWGYSGSAPIANGITVTDNSGTGTATLASVTEATGPNFIDNADNWYADEVPGTSEATDVWVDNSDVSLLYGLFATAHDLTSLNVAANFTAEIGLPKTNGGGYPEFRPDYLIVNAAAVTIGYGDGSGSGRIKLDSEAVTTAVVVESTGSSAEPGLGALLWKGTDASNTLRVQSGSVSVCIFNGETAAITNVMVAAGTVEFGQGQATIETYTQQGGDVSTRSTFTAGTVSGGTLTLNGAAAGSSTLIVDGGTLIHKSTGVMTALTLGGPSGPVLDCDQDNSFKVITTLTVKSSFSIIDTLETLTDNGSTRPLTLTIAAGVKDLSGS